MEKLRDVAGHEHDEAGRFTAGAADAKAIESLVKEAKAQGVDEEFIKKVIVASETPEDTIADLKVLAEPKGKKLIPRLPPLEPYERELEVFEESLFLETLAGEHQPETIVG